MTRSASPVARFRPSLWARLTPWGPASLALLGLGVIGATAPILGVLKVGLSSVLTSLSSNAALAASVVGIYLALFVVQALPGLMSRREIILFGDRLEVRDGRRVQIHPLMGLSRVEMTHHIVSFQSDLWLVYRTGDRAQISGRLMGTQVVRLAKILEGDLN